MPIDPHLWGADAPAFAERVMRLAGQTTYRMPAAGRGGAALDMVPDAHAIAAALAYGRLGPEDIGPDVAYCWVLQSDAYRNPVVRRLALALRGNATRGLGRFTLAAAGVAWRVLVHGERIAAPPQGVSARDWELLVWAALGTLHTAAWDALTRAERAYRGRH